MGVLAFSWDISESSRLRLSSVSGKRITWPAHLIFNDLTTMSLIFHSTPDRCSGRGKKFDGRRSVTPIPLCCQTLCTFFLIYDPLKRTLIVSQLVPVAWRRDSMSFSRWISSKSIGYSSRSVKSWRFHWAPGCKTRSGPTGTVESKRWARIQMFFIFVTTYFVGAMTCCSLR